MTVQAKKDIMTDSNGTPDAPALLLTAKQTAAALAISERKLWSLTNSGEIAHVRIGRSVRYPISGLQRWIESQTQGG